MIGELRQKGLLFPLPGERPKLQNTFRQKRAAGRIHYAMDIPAKRGTPILSTDSGRVLKLHRNAQGGLMLYTADPTERYIYYYAHLDRYRSGLHEGQLLARGDTIGYVGTTGNAPPDTPHLHFAILRSYDIRRWSRGTPINPYMVFADSVRPDLLAK
jgi:peptidoglycan LD-endopeptidase LytH